MRVFEPGDIVKLQSPLYSEHPVGVVVKVWTITGGGEEWQGTEVDWWNSSALERPEFSNSRHLDLYWPWPNIQHETA